jgi:phosphoribosyl 1,2-cyclic phosphodiesterase
MLKFIFRSADFFARNTIRKIIRVTFWGVRGSVPVPSADKMGFGGNTSCLEVQLLKNEAHDTLLLDCGTGARAAGESILRRLVETPKNMHIFFSHFHWDHIQGIPFFSPLYDRASDIRFYSHESAERTREILVQQMRYPYFPIDFEDLPGQLSFYQIDNSGIQLGDATISSFALNHPQGSWGYRIEAGNCSVVYACDHEHGVPACDDELDRAANGADVLIYDSHFTPSEYEARKGWGHSTWLEGARLAMRANVKQLILFHHSPDRTDEALEEIVRIARTIFPSTLAAKEGMIVDI